MICIVLDSSVLINLLFIAGKFRNFIEKFKKLLKIEDSEIFLPKIIADKEITNKAQRDLLQNLLKDRTIKLIEVNEDEIENAKRIYSFRLGSGEIAMSISVKNFLKVGKSSIGFTNEKLVVKKMGKEIPMLHGLWFYTRMFFREILNKTELNELISLANEDMKIEAKELENIKIEYLNKKASLKEIINLFVIDNL